MSQRTRGKSSGSGAAGPNRPGARRVSSAPIKKPFPYGFVAGVTAIALFLVAIIVYAVQNRGEGFETALDRTDAKFSGLQVTDNPSSNHVTTRVDYPDEATKAPDGGNHNPYPQTCAVYTSAIVPEHAVHSMEHGAVWVTYAPSLPADQVTILSTLVQGNQYRLLSPYPGQTSPVALQAWGRRLDVPSATDPRVTQFLDDYTDGPQTREKGASCSGVDQPGTVPFVLGPDGQSFVPGDATSKVPAEGTVPSGAAGSAAPGTVPMPTSS